MLSKSLTRQTFMILFVAGSGLTPSFAPYAAKAVYWFDKDSGTEIYLFPSPGYGCRLTVVSLKDFEMTYNTKNDGRQPVCTRLAAKEIRGEIKYFEFDHSFSKTSVEMSLGFTVDGGSVPSLTRTFRDNIFGVAESESFD